MTTTADRATTTQQGDERPVFDPIDLEVVRSRLEAIGEQAALAVEHTAISPTITESKDYSVTIMDPEGGLIVGSGMVLFHFGAASYSIKATIERFGDSIAPGDVFFANDPHHGGGLHPQDVMIQRPIFHHDELVGWVGLSAHMMDMGGMVVGSFAPQATDCYQEGLRLPAVRLFRKGEEMTDIWDIIVNNIRMSEIVEMDLRGLVAGCHSAQEQLEAVVESMGRERFVESLRAIRELTEAEMRRRILAIEDGVYRSTSWTEYGNDFFQIPCTLTVEGDHIILDFEGASPQTDHYFNSKPYIVAAEFIVMLAHRIARDLPFNEGIFAPVELRCPEGSIVNSTPPAPIAAAHMHVGLNAADVAMQAFNLALGASPESLAHRYLTGAGFESALGNNLWSWQLPDGTTDAFLAFDGNWVGGSAGRERDGMDLGRNPVGIGAEGSIADIEILESWFPLLFTERRARPGSGGAGVHRAGGGTQMRFQPHGVEQVNGTMFGMRRWLPLQGMAGGAPGACNEFLVHHRDGSTDELDPNSAGTPMIEGDSFEMRLASGGGFGDALDRDPGAVAADVASGRFSADDADRIYGTVLTDDGSVDPGATAARREEIRRDRLARANPPLRPQGDRLAPDAADGAAYPLYPGVVQRGTLAIAEATGQVLAEAPAHWTDGCPVLEERRWPDDGPDVVFRTYLDPASGRALHVEVALADGPRSFEVNPLRWTGVR
jgi:N-methylhydantoinase B